MSECNEVLASEVILRPEHVGTLNYRKSFLKVDTAQLL